MACDPGSAVMARAFCYGDHPSAAWLAVRGRDPGEGGAEFSPV